MGWVRGLVLDVIRVPGIVVAPLYVAVIGWSPSGALGGDDYLGETTILNWKSPGPMLRPAN